MAKKRDPLKATEKPKVAATSKKKATTAKTTTKKATAKKAPAKKAAPKKTTTAKKAPVKKTVAKKAEPKVVLPTPEVKTKFWTPPKIIVGGIVVLILLAVLF